MFHPDTAQWKGIAECGRTFVPEFSLANMSFVRRKVRDGKIADDFKHVSYHS